jgi:hypothetical protein
LRCAHALRVYARDDQIFSAHDNLGMDTELSQATL